MKFIRLKISDRNAILRRFNKLVKTGNIGALFARVGQYSFCRPRLVLLINSKIVEIYFNNEFIEIEIGEIMADSVEG